MKETERMNATDKTHLVCLFLFPPFQTFTILPFSLESEVDTLSLGRKVFFLVCFSIDVNHVVVKVFN